MAHYAFLNSDNKVISVITGVDEWITQTDTDGAQVGGSAEAWEAFYAAQPWLGAASCKRTSSNNNIRKNYAGYGFTYDTVRDAFIGAQPHASWILDEATCRWQPPVPVPVPPPGEGGEWIWDEDTLSWTKLTPP